MIVKSVKATVIRLPFSIKIGAMPRFNASGTLVEVETDEGIVGYSMTHFPFSDRSLARYIEEVLSKIVVGKDPFMIEAIWRDMYNTCNRILLGIAQATSAVECALWDVVGKALKTPVYRLLGGFKEKVKAYASFPFALTPKAASQMAETARKRSFQAVKLRIGEGLKKDEEIIKTVREEHPDLEIMVDANSAYNEIREAVKLSEICDRYDVRWLEEPLPSDNLAALSELRARSAVEIAGGENDFSLFRFKEILDMGAYDIVQPDATRCGGILQCKKIAALAEAYGVQSIPHIFGFGLVMAANLQVIAATYNSNYMEYPLYPDEFYLLEKPIEVRDGYALVPKEPGLGVQVNFEAIEKYAEKSGK
ncbi:MAG: mandelate racemase/muconate lactonizing enzyme family protein [Nitrososphaerota archaeon]